MEANEANLMSLNKSIESKFELTQRTLAEDYRKKEAYWTNTNNNLISKLDSANEKLKSAIAAGFEEKEKNEVLLSKNNTLTMRLKELENAKEDLELKLANLSNLNKMLEEKEKKKKQEYDNNLARIEGLWKEQYDRVSLSPSLFLSLLSPPLHPVVTSFLSSSRKSTANLKSRLRIHSLLSLLTRPSIRKSSANFEKVLNRKILISCPSKIYRSATRMS